MVEPIRLSPDDARALIEYNQAVFERYVRQVRRIPRRGAFRPRGIGHESWFETLVHILHVHEVWLVYIVHGKNRDRDLEPLFKDSRRKPSDWTEFAEYSARVWAGVRATARWLTPRFLGRRVRAPWMPGTYTASDGVLQTTFEQAHHLGEIIGSLWQEDREPAEMTWLDTRRPLGRARGRRR